MPNYFKVEPVPNSPISLVYLEDRFTQRVCLGYIEQLSHTSRGYAAGVGSFADCRGSVPFDLETVYGFIDEEAGCNYLYKLYLAFKGE